MTLATDNNLSPLEDALRILEILSHAECVIEIGNEVTEHEEATKPQGTTFITFSLH